MEEIQVINSQLPTVLEDLAKYVMVGREKLVALQAELRAIDKVGLVAEVRKQKLTEAQDIADALLLAEMRLGELISEIPESPGKRTDLNPEDDVQRSKKDVVQALGFSVKTAQRFETLAKHPDIVASMSAEARADGEIISRTSILKAIAKKPFVINNSGNTEWYTPKQYIESARKVMGSIDLDPASSKEAQKIVRAAKYYDSKADGLTKKWKGNIWLNPLRLTRRLCLSIMPRRRNGLQGLQKGHRLWFSIQVVLGLRRQSLMAKVQLLVCKVRSFYILAGT